MENEPLSYLFLYEKLKIYPISVDPKTSNFPTFGFLKKSVKNKDYIQLSNYKLRDKMDYINLGRFIDENKSNSNDNLYLSGPVYEDGDYQLVVTGKHSYDISGFSLKNGVMREISEELGLFSNNKNVIECVPEIKNSFKVNVKKLFLLGENIDKKIYNTYMNCTHEEIKNIEKKNKKSINVVVYGDLNDFLKIYNNKSFLIRPKFSEKDIVGVIFLPLNTVEKILMNKK